MAAETAPKRKGRKRAAPPPVYAWGRLTKAAIFEMTFVGSEALTAAVESATAEAEAARDWGGYGETAVTVPQHAGVSAHLHAGTAVWGALQQDDKDLVTAHCLYVASQVGQVQLEDVEDQAERLALAAARRFASYAAAAAALGARGHRCSLPLDVMDFIAQHFGASKTGFKARCP